MYVTHCKPAEEYKENSEYHENKLHFVHCSATSEIRFTKILTLKLEEIIEKITYV